MVRSTNQIKTYDVSVNQKVKLNSLLGLPVPKSLDKKGFLNILKC